MKREDRVRDLVGSTTVGFVVGLVMYLSLIFQSEGDLRLFVTVVSAIFGALFGVITHAVISRHRRAGERRLEAGTEGEGARPGRRQAIRIAVVLILVFLVWLTSYWYFNSPLDPWTATILAGVTGALVILNDLVKREGAAVAGEAPGGIDGGRSGRRRLLALSVSLALFCVLAVTVWLRVEPILNRGERPPTESSKVDEAKVLRESLRPLHPEMGEPGPRDWLSVVKESGQTYEEYMDSRPVTPNGRRSVLYIQPLGDFTPRERQIVELTAEFMGLYFDRPVQVLETLPSSVLPPRARRLNHRIKVVQVLTTFVLRRLLKPRLPYDAAAMLALTKEDLYPGAGWNFVFGQASLRERVGVWSINRYGSPDEGEEAFRLCLRRTLQTASHETGHMFSMYHCTAYKCNMSGSNSLGESDRLPLALCPECLAKLRWAIDFDPVKRYRLLEDFAAHNALTAEEDRYRELREGLGVPDKQLARGELKVH